MTPDSTYPRQIEPIYRQVVNKNIKTLAITAADTGEGTTMIALALAKRHAQQGKSTLLVDFNLASASLNKIFNLHYTDKDTLLESLSANITTTSIANLSVLAAPINTKFLIQLYDYEQIKKILQQWSLDYSMVIIDCSNLCYNTQDIIPPELICTLVDSCILVVKAARTVETKIVEATAKLAHAHVLGTVINDQHNPRMADVLCESTHSLDRLLPKTMHKLRNKIHRSTFLSIEV